MVYTGRQASLRRWCVTGRRWGDRLCRDLWKGAQRWGGKGLGERINKVADVAKVQGEQREAQPEERTLSTQALLSWGLQTSSTAVWVLVGDVESQALWTYRIRIRMLTRSTVSHIHAQVWEVQMKGLLSHIRMLDFIRRLWRVWAREQHALVSILKWQHWLSFEKQTLGGARAEAGS